MKLEDIFKLPALEAAPLLLGCYVCRQTPQGLIKLRIVEVEAYHQDDPASHSYRGVTNRTAPMFKSGGRLYIYFTYGIHHAINIVTGSAGRGEAVLLRAAEPVEGVEVMYQNRSVTDIKQLASGPGKLAQALGVTDTKLSGRILNKSSIFIELADNPVHAKTVVTSPRIGITKAADRPWRFYLEDNPFVSKPR